MENKLTAREMFEELGYEQKMDTMGMYYYKFSSKYEKNNYSGHDWENTIRFDSYKKNIYSDKYINLQLLQAINKQIEELGWK